MAYPKRTPARLTHAQAFRQSIPMDPFPGCAGELLPAGDGGSAPKSPASPGVRAREGVYLCRACLSRLGVRDGTITWAERGFRPRKGRRNS